MNIAIRYRDRIDQTVFLPQVNWRKATNERRTQSVEAAAFAAVPKG
jgi:hypothetical protein